MHGTQNHMFHCTAIGVRNEYRTSSEDKTKHHRIYWLRLRNDGELFLLNVVTLETRNYVVLLNDAVALTSIRALCYSDDVCVHVYSTCSAIT